MSEKIYADRKYVESFAGASSWNDLKDKPFDKTILENANHYVRSIGEADDLYFELSDGLYVSDYECEYRINYYHNGEPVGGIIPGCEYSINFRNTLGSSKTFTAKAQEESSYIILGNFNLATGGTDGEDYLIGYQYSDGQHNITIGIREELFKSIIGSDTENTLRVTLTGDTYLWEPLDEGYIPNSIARKSDIPTAGDYVTSVNEANPDYYGAVWVAPYKKRTGWEKNTNGLYVSKAMPGYEETDSNAARYTYIEIKPVEIAVGDTYQFSIADCSYNNRGNWGTYVNRYSFEAELKQIPDTERLYVGNAIYMGYSDIDDDDDNTICIEFHHNNNVAYAVTIYHKPGRCLTENSAATDNFTLYTPVMHLEKLDKRLLPDGVARVTDIPEVNYPVTSVNGMTGDVSIDIPEAYTLPIAGTELGGVKNGGNVAVGEDGTMNVEIPEGFSGSWNDLSDRPFYSKNEEKEAFMVSISIPTSVAISNGSFSYDMSQGIGVTSSQFKDADVAYLSYESATVFYSSIKLTLVPNSGGFDWINEETGTRLTFYTVQFDKWMEGTGLPTQWNESDRSLKVSFYKLEQTEVVQTIGEKYIPDTIARTSDIPEIPDAVVNPSDAAIGQTIVIKAVDENGKPTEWEAVDPWVITSSTSDSTKKFKLTIDDDGVLTATEIVDSET